MRGVHVAVAYVVQGRDVKAQAELKLHKPRDDKRAHFIRAEVLERDHSVNKTSSDHSNYSPRGCDGVRSLLCRRLERLTAHSIHGKRRNGVQPPWILRTTMDFVSQLQNPTSPLHVTINGDRLCLSRPTAKVNSQKSPFYFVPH